MQQATITFPPGEPCQLVALRGLGPLTAPDTLTPPEKKRLIEETVVAFIRAKGEAQRASARAGGHLSPASLDQEEGVLLHVNSDESWYWDPTRPFELVEESVSTATGLATVRNESFSAASAAPARLRQRLRQSFRVWCQATKE